MTNYALFLRSLDPRDGGPPNAVMHTAAAANRAGDNAVVLTTGVLNKTPPRAGWLEAWGAVRTLGGRTGRPTLPSGSVFVRAIPYIARADRVSIHGPYVLASAQVALLCLLLGTPYSVQPHGSAEPYQRGKGSRLKRAYELAVVRPMLRHAHVVIVATQSESTGVKALEPMANVSVAGLGVSIPSAKGFPLGARREPTIAIVGRVAPKKRVDLALSALSILRTQWGVHAVLHVVGDGDRSLVRELHAQAVSLRVEDQVQWHGHLGDREVGETVSMCSVVIVPSDNENFGQVVGEAMALGKPVVATDQVAAAEHIQNARSGAVVPSGDAFALAAAIHAILQDAEGAAEMGQRARKYATENLSWDSVWARWTLAWESDPDM